MSFRPVSPHMVPKFKTEPKIAIIVSQFNEEVTSGLLKGAQSLLLENNLSQAEIFETPGAFELPLIALALAKTGRYEGVVALGCVIKGETAHFEYISAETARGLMEVQMITGLPASFGVLTVYSHEEALARSGEDESNKGREATLACLHSIYSLRQIQNRDSR